MKLERPTKPIQIAMLTLPQNQHPDEAIGGYRMNADNSPAMVTSMDTGNDISNAAILLHEYIESMWCWVHKIDEKRVRDFDTIWFIEERQGVKHSTDEPGSDKRCPCYTGHILAEKFEREFIYQFGLTWEQHEENCERIYATEASNRIQDNATK